MVEAGQVYRDTDPRCRTAHVRVERPPEGERALCQRVQECEPNLGCWDGWLPIGPSRYIAVTRLLNPRLFRLEEKV